MDWLDIYNHSKSLAFKKFKRLLYKYPEFVKTYKKQPNRSERRQFLVLLPDSIPNMKHVWSTDRLLKNANILNSGTGKNPTTALYSETTKNEIFFDKKKQLKVLLILLIVHHLLCNRDLLKIMRFLVT